MTHRDLAAQPGQDDAPTEHPHAQHFMLGSDIEEVCQLFLEQRQSIGLGLTDAHFELEERKILRIRDVLLRLGFPTDLAVRVEDILPELMRRDEVAARGLSLDDLMARSSVVTAMIEPIMYEVRDAMTDDGAAWYDLGVMVSRLSMCLSYLHVLRDEPRSTAGRDPWDVYSRELGHVSRVLCNMITAHRHAAVSPAAIHVAHLIDALEPLLAQPDPASARWTTSVSTIVDAIFVAHGVSVISGHHLEDTEHHDVADMDEEPDDATALVVAERARLLDLMEHGDVVAAHTGLTDLHRLVSDTHSPAHLIALHLQIDLCTVKARLGQVDYATDLLHDIATTAAFHHGPRTAITAELQVRVLSALLHIRGRTDATVFRGEHLAWLTALPDHGDLELQRVAQHLEDFDQAARTEAGTTTLEELRVILYNGDFADAEAGLQRLLADLPAGDTAVLSLRCQAQNALALAMACQDDGRSKQAEKLARQATESCERAFGPRAPTTTAVQVETVFVLMFTASSRRLRHFVTGRLGWLLASDPAALPAPHRANHDRLQEVLSGRAAGIDPADQ